MPDTLVRKRSAKLQEYERMFKSDPRSASEAKQVFSALNAQLMAELPKLSALAESLFLSSVASLTYLVGQLLAKLNSQHPRPSSENNTAARQKFTRSNNELWLAIQKLELVSTNFNRPKPEPVLLSNTQSQSERTIVENLGGYAFEAKTRWISGDRKDLRVSQGDLLQKVNDQIVQGKILVFNGSKRGYVPIKILSPLSKKNSSYNFNGSSESTAQQKLSPDASSTTSNLLIDFETVVEPLPAAASTKNSDGKFHIDAKFDFTRRSTAELTVHEGERLMVVNQADADGNSDWWYVRNSLGESGYVPRSYLVSEADL
ncbi:unnamed protein product [Oikopleura dioica]|uniref:SH3 domain-containing protein n=1 Tax=Oikopleura dioica TaxID=34765 RepID=E4WPW8_OIKDI|nr:unnamed protein product [Oikopleura dioica]